MPSALLIAFVAITCSITTVVMGHEIRVTNRCGQTVDVGVLNNPNKMLPMNGGFRLNTGQQVSFPVPFAWAGRLWGRTGCDGNGRGCQTGFCGGKSLRHTLLTSELIMSLIRRHRVPRPRRKAARLAGGDHI